MSILPIKHYSIPAKCGAGGSSCPLNDVDLSSLVPKAWLTKYDELILSEGDILRTDKTGAYTPQGSCTDGEYIYRACVMEDDAPTMIQKYRLDTGELVTQVTKNSFGHANDMTFANGYLYIAHSSSTSTVYKVDPNTFDIVETFELPLTIWGIAYDATNDLFLFGGVGSAYISVYYPNFEFMYRIKPDNPFYGFVRQGISCDSNYIYVALDNAYGAVIGNEKGSRVMVYTWNGIFVKSYHIAIAEIESVFTHNGKMYIGTYEGRDENDVKSGIIYRVAFDHYPEQTVITGRPTDVSGGLNNLQRLPEGTPVRLWQGAMTSGALVLDSKSHGIKVTESSPFRFLRIRFKGANQGVFDWYPVEDGVAAIRETDITAATADSNFRIREARLTFNVANQTFTISSNFADGFMWDKSENAWVVTKYTDSSEIELIEINQIWGVV